MFGLPPLRRTYDAALRDLASRRPEVRASAAQDLASVGDQNPRAAADALVPLLADESADVRGAALSALGSLGARHLTDAVAARFDDDDSTVRQVAVIALTELGGPRATEVLRASLAHARPDVRYQALLGLTTVDPEEGFEASLGALASEDVWIASEAAAQLGLLLAPHPHDDLPSFTDDARRRAVGALVSCMEGDAPARVRVASAIALGRLGDPRALPHLVAFVRRETRIEGEDGDELLATAIGLLGALGDETTRSALEPLAWRVFPSLHRALARAALARLGDLRAAGEIVGQLRSPWANRRNAAVRLAGSGRVRGAVEELLSLLSNGGAEPVAVIDALGKIRDPRAEPALERIARTSEHADLREAARYALTSIEGAKAEEVSR